MSTLNGLLEHDSLVAFAQWMGCAFGMIGSVRLAIPGRAAALGFVAYLVSNAFWICFALMTQAPGLLLMQVFFTCSSLLGLWLWAFRPRRQQQFLRVDPKLLRYRSPRLRPASTPTATTRSTSGALR